MRKVLLFGAGGLLGRDVFRLLESSDTIDVEGISHDRVDFADRVGLRKFLDSFSPNPFFIVNCAGVSDEVVCESEPDKAFAVNGHAPWVLGQYGAENDVPVIHISTSWVFAGTKHLHYRENDATCPLNVYGASKLLGEKLLQGYNPKHIIIRTSALHGEFGDDWMDELLRKAQNKESIRLENDRMVCPTHTHDLAALIHKLIDSDFRDYGIYNYAGLGACSWYDLGQFVLNELGHDAPIEGVPAVELGESVTRPHYTALDCSKIAGLHPPRPWQEGVRDHLQHREIRS